MDVEALKRAVCAEVDRLADQLMHASHEIHAHPELNFEEHFAHDLLIDLLRERAANRPLTPTASTPRSRRRRVSNGFNVAVLCEYDALPGIGHACGHNVIATAGLGAGLAAASVADAGRWHAAHHGHAGRGGRRRQDRRWRAPARSTTSTRR